jgi:uncharacterized protein YcbX
VSFTVTELNIYPIKSCMGIARQSVEVAVRGLLHDRQWMLVGDNGVALTQRDFSKMALIKVEVIDNDQLWLKLSAPGAPDFQLAKQENTKELAAMRVEVWDYQCQALDQGDAIAQWFSTYLNTTCRLVQMNPDFVRSIDAKYAVAADDQVNFQDEFPLLVISEASLADLNSRLSDPLPMNRFRPNVVVSGCEAFAEDTWDVIQIDGVKFSVVKPCARCVITTIDQTTAARGVEPLRTLAGYRGIGNKVMFGQNLIHHGPGTLRLGSEVKVTSMKEAPNPRLTKI